jgi:hypothetical protein
MNKYIKHLAWIIGFLAVGCSNHDFQLAGDENGFTQSSKTISVPIDILWVVDNSGSMATSQSQVATNVTSFIEKFKNTNFDFQIAVTTTEAYKSQAMFGGVSSWSRFRDGRDDTSHTGVFVMDKDTPNLESVFQTNILQGIDGSADERGFQSLVSAMSNTDNLNQFPRKGAFLAVIFMTDEEDFSWNGTANIQLDSLGNPNVITDPRLDPISQTTDFLDTLTDSTATKKNYNVNTIAIFDQTCLNALSTDFPGRRIAERYAELTDATGGVKASLCDDFSGILSNLTDSILIQTTKFYLNREPQIDSLEIYVNEALYPSSKWDYNVEDNSISFHADSIPAKDASIRVKFQPKTLK